MSILQRAIARLHGPPNFRGKGRLMRLLLKFVAVAPSKYGPKLTVRSGDATFLASLLGRYGSELVSLIQALPSSSIFLDIGSNTGIYSLVAGSHLTDGAVVAIEPNPYVFRDLVNNILANDVKNVIPLNFTVGQETAAVPFHFMAHHTGKGAIASGGTAARAQISVVSASEFAKILPPLTGRKVLCKIDTEGSEYEILTALRSAGTINQVHTFYIEIDERYLARRGATVSDCYDLLYQCGFVPRTNRRGLEGHYDEIFERAEAH